MARSPDLARLQRRLMAIPEAVKRELRPTLEKSADEVVTMARRLAPVDDGTLRASIRREPGDHDLEVRVEAGGEATTREVRRGSGVDYDYALAVEYGTIDTPAQPFFWPAYRLSSKRIKSRAKRAISKAVKRTQKG
ncbi:HK97 gp10 family phage protein [Ancylobacter sp. VKM B-3255]|uniref:HK97 gp10 family phage protein n=1 Tax=Ancylobacter radicis TaxID=2836179 RepID=A0ABS5R1J6_9HYPH|nr:HK97 gp10 family phage protein [Ancylobacter radicis]